MLILLNALPNFDAAAIVYWMVGYARFNGIEDKLEIAGYPAPEENGIIGGGEWYFILHRYMIGVGGFNAIDLPDLNIFDDDTDVSLEALYFGLGYTLFKSRTILIYPAIGIGGGNLTAVAIDIRSFPYTHYVKIEGEGFLVKGGVGLVYAFGPIITGLNVGATYLRPANWKINGNGTTNYPSGDYTLFWAALNIGIGAW